MKRRRFLRLWAAAGLIAASPARAFRLDPVDWRGMALGAPASLTIHHEDRNEAMKLIGACMAEIERLERVFSLYRDDSALVRLNRQGRLDAPPLDLVRLLTIAGHFWRLSDGAFDPTVQPLWELNARHFARPDADPAGPPAPAVERALNAVGWPGVSVGSEAIVLGRPGMGLTLNGIAQGYVTDRVADLLRRNGMRHVLVNMGEIAAVGARFDGSAWRVALPGGETIALGGGALAVSDPGGTRLGPRCTHIFDPASGRSPDGTGRVVRVAPTATEADALSTAAVAMAGRRR